MTKLKQIIETTPELAALGQDYPAIAAWLAERPLIDNPTPQQNVPLRISLKQVLALVPSPERVAVRNLNDFIEDLKAAIDNQDRDYMAALLEDAATAGAISGATVAELQQLLATTEPDPAWTAQIPGAPRWQALGLDSAPSAADVQLAMNGGG